jgi:NADH dehydrogenase FAD-containing subunit
LDRSESQPRVVVVGGGYGGFATAKALDEIAAVNIDRHRELFGLQPIPTP